MSIKVFPLAILASLLCFSCSETNEDYNSNLNNTPSTKTLNTYNVDIEARTDSSNNSAAAPTRADMPFKMSEENIGGKTVLYPKINITQPIISSVVVLYNKSNNTKEVVEANWRVEKDGTTVKLLLNNLSTHNNLEVGEWYLMSFIGGGEKSGDNLNVNTNTTINVIEKNQEFTTSCPFATNWRRIVKSGNKLKLNDETTKMVFKPQGVFLVLSLENRMGLDTRINRELTLESNAFCSSGTYKFNIAGNTVADNSDLASSYWEPNSANAISGESDVYKKYNAQHYTTTIKLNYESNKDDGSLRRGKTDIANYMYFNSYNKSGAAAQNTKTNRGFLLCLMPVNYKKTSNYVGIVNETLLFGKVEVTNSNRVNYTNDATIYGTSGKSDPTTWRPYMGSRYLLGSFSNELAKGSCYDMTLRIIRPMLPIERLWAYRQGDAMQKRTRNNSKGIAEGTTNDGYYPTLTSKLYRLPKYSEFIPIFNNPKLQLEKNEKIGNVSSFDAGAGYGPCFTVGSHRDFVDLNGVQRKFDNWFCSVKGSNVLYGIMYMKPVDNRDPKPTNNYKVAVRMTLPSPRATSGKIKVEEYYLGPNYNLSFNVAGYYMCHEDFWKRIDRKEIIERTFWLDTYWVKDDGQLNSYEFMPFAAELSLNGVAQSNKMNKGGTHYFIPWLKAPAWQ